MCVLSEVRRLCRGLVLMNGHAASKRQNIVASNFMIQNNDVMKDVILNCI